jgi:hypothetical protein
MTALRLILLRNPGVVAVDQPLYLAPTAIMQMVGDVPAFHFSGGRQARVE